MFEFRKYPPETPEEERKGSPICVVTYPEACGRAAVGEVWSMPFCEAHGNEAHAAARIEAVEDAEGELGALLGSMGESLIRNPLIREALGILRLSDEAPPAHDHGEVIRAAYILRESDTDPDTLAFDYSGIPDRDDPYDWWCEAREMAVGFMREAYEVGQPHLLRTLEAMREYATVQQELALDDMERRFVQPRRAAREERQRTEPAGHAPAEILAATNGALASAIDLLETLPAEGAFDREAVRKARAAIAEAGFLVATEEGRVSEKVTPA
jgi:hypothetical protein